MVALFDTFQLSWERVDHCSLPNLSKFCHNTTTNYETGPKLENWNNSCVLSLNEEGFVEVCWVIIMSSLHSRVTYENTISVIFLVTYDGSTLPSWFRPSSGHFQAIHVFLNRNLSRSREKNKLWEQGAFGCDNPEQCCIYYGTWTQSFWAKELFRKHPNLCGET